jgi:hypothetical protein
VTTAPAKTDYSVGERLSTLGLVVTASYTGGTAAVVAGWTVDKTADLTVSDTTVTVSYTEGENDKTATFNITVTARTLTGIAITSQPAKKSYVEGQAFDKTGMTVTASYGDGSSKPVTDYLVVIGTNGSSSFSLGDTAVIVGYTEDGGSTYSTAEVTGITVAARALTGLTVKAQPAKTAYKTGEKFEKTGMTVEAVYNGGILTKPVTAYTVDKTGALTAADNKITVSYTEGDVTRTADVAITVTARTLTGITVTALPGKTVYTAGEYFDRLGAVITAHYSDSPDATVIAYTVDKTGALTAADTTVTVSYTENGVTKTAQITITVNAVAAGLPQEVTDVITAIGVLPDTSRLTIIDRSAVEYINALYEALSPANKLLVSNYAALQAAVAKIAELEENGTGKPPSQTVYEIYYRIYEGSFDDVYFGGNPDEYAAADGRIYLADASSETAAASGYEFIGWRDDDTWETVTYLENLTGNKYLYAVFELTENIALRFIDKVDGETVLYETIVSRVYGWYNFYDNGITEKIANAANRFAYAFYDASDDGGRVYDYNFFYTEGVAVNIYAASAAAREVTLTHEYDWEISFDFTPPDGDLYGNSYNVGTSLKLPVGALITVNVLNDDITDILVDGLSAGAASFYQFALAAGEAPVAISFVKTVSTGARVIFTADFTSYVYRVVHAASDGWDGLLTEGQLDDIYNYSMEYYYEYAVTYTVNGATALSYAELASYEFAHGAGAATVVTATRVYNVFELGIYFANGDYSDYWLSWPIFGKYTVAKAIDGDGLAQAAFGLTLYTDAARTIPFTENIDTLKPTRDLTLYAARRAAFTISFSAGGGSAAGPINIPADNGNNYYTLNLPVSAKAGHVFMGWSLEDGGAVIDGYIYCEYILVNYNRDVTLYAVWLQLADATGSPLLGVWVAYGGEYFLEFRADGTGGWQQYDYTEEFFYFQDDDDVSIIFWGGYNYSLYLPSALDGDTLLFFDVTFVKTDAALVEVTVHNDDGGVAVRRYLGTAQVSDLYTLGLQSYYYIGKTRIDDARTFSEIAVGGKVTLWAYPVYKITGGYGDIRFIDLDTQGGTLPEALPEFISIIGGYGAFFRHRLDMFAPEKAGMLFAGWYTAAAGGDLIDNIYSLTWSEYASISKLYARYADGGAVDYTGSAFAGTWSAAYIDNFGDYITVTFVLNADGTYAYAESCNGEPYYSAAGAYRLNGADISIITLENVGDYLYFMSKSDLTLNLMFIDDNILVAAGNILIKGAVKPADYEGEDIVGTYRYYVVSGDYEQSMLLVFSGNGTVVITAGMKYDGETETETETANGYYRIRDGRVWIISNSMGVEDFTEYMSALTRVGGNYGGLPVLGTWTAADAVTASVFSLLILDSDGVITFISPDGEYKTLYNILGENYYAVILDNFVCYATYTAGAVETLTITVDLDSDSLTLNYVRAA